MQLKKTHIIALISMLFLTCTQQSIDNDQDIYTLVINKIAYPVPPPPPSLQNKIQDITEQTLDSIKKVPMTVAVYPFKIKFSFNDKDDQIHADSPVTYEDSKAIINFNKLNARESITLKLIKDEEKDLSNFYNIYDGVLRVSDIKYNQDNTKAIVLISFSRGKLSGSLIQFYLEFKNNTWEIVSRKTLLIS